MTRRRHQVQRGRRRHRGRPGQRGADPRAAAAAPPRRRLPRRGGRRRRRHAPGSAGSSTRSTAPSTSSTACRSTPSRSPPSADGEVVAGVVINVASRHRVRRPSPRPGHDGVGRDPRRPADRASARPAPLRQRLVATGFNYDARLRGLQARALVRLLPRVRDIRRLGSCALDLCHVAEGTARRLRRGGRQPLGPRRRRTGRPGAPAPGSSSPPGPADATWSCVLRHTGSTSCRDAVRQAGFLARSPAFRGNRRPVTGCSRDRVVDRGVRDPVRDGAQSGADDAAMTSGARLRGVAGPGE